MKSLSNFIFSLLFVFCTYSCSNEVDSIDDQINSILEEEYEPYISDQMKEILSMIDTCTTPIPIQTLIPDIDAIISSTFNETSLTKSTSSGASVVTGYSKYSTLYSDQSVLIDATTAANMNMAFSPGTYTTSCVAVTYYLLCNGTVFDAFENTDVIGMNPDDFSQRGYAIEEKVANRLYYFTTYLFYLNSSWYPRIPAGSSSEAGYYTYFILNDYLNAMQWRYFEL